MNRDVTIFQRISDSGFLLAVITPWFMYAEISHAVDNAADGTAERLG